MPPLHSSKYYPEPRAEHRDRHPCNDGRGREAPAPTTLEADHSLRLGERFGLDLVENLELNELR